VKNKTDLLCACGDRLIYFFDDAGCGTLRCIRCGKTSGYCSSQWDAEINFQRLYNHDTRKLKPSKPEETYDA
jgi:hypothetical protein